MTYLAFMLYIRFGTQLAPDLFKENFIRKGFAEWLPSLLFEDRVIYEDVPILLQYSLAYTIIY